VLAASRADASSMAATPSFARRRRRAASTSLRATRCATVGSVDYGALANWKQNFFGWNTRTSWGADKLERPVATAGRRTRRRARSSSCRPAQRHRDVQAGGCRRPRRVRGAGIQAIVASCAQRPRLPPSCDGHFAQHKPALMPIIDRVNAAWPCSPTAIVRFVNINDRLAGRRRWSRG
jgi:hypothetical protein